MHKLFTIIIVAICSSVTAQNSSNLNFSFQDSFGNSFTVDIDKLPKPIDKALLLNLSTLDFNKKAINDTLCFNFYISEIKKTKKVIGFDLRVMEIPSTNDIKIMRKYLGHGHFLMKLEKFENKFQIKSVEYFYSEL